MLEEKNVNSQIWGIEYCAAFPVHRESRKASRYLLPFPSRLHYQQGYRSLRFQHIYDPHVDRTSFQALGKKAKKVHHGVKIRVRAAVGALVK
jgi:hypothetical protein